MRVNIFRRRRAFVGVVSIAKLLARRLPPHCTLSYAYDMCTLQECYAHVQYIHVHTGTLPERYAHVRYIRVHMDTLPECYAHVQYIRVHIGNVPECYARVQ